VETKKAKQHKRYNNKNNTMKTKKTLVIVAVMASLVIVKATSNCPQPAPAGKCGKASEGASCANNCVSTSGAAQTDIKNCTGADGTKVCQYNTINWSVAYNYYYQNPPLPAVCTGCTTTTIPYLPTDPAHPPTAAGTCQDAYVGTTDCSTGG